MKTLKLTLLITLFISTFSAKADEGMWLPNLIKAMNYSDMQSKGLMISAEDLYSANKSSIKDAVVHFNGGCTAEVVSSKGLIFTNHHCGYGQIAAHSTPEKNYLKDGFWAKNHKEELKSDNLYVDFIISIEDVTAHVMPSGNEDPETIKKNIAAVSKKIVAGSKYRSIIKPFNYGNKYFAFVYERYNDVRLVGAPPSAIGKFGFDTDNWVWPRHTGDFSIFRIYANKDNQPADYSTENIPYTPKHFFPISLEGVKEGDFSMVYGFPGSTEQFLTSYAVDQKINYSNPAKISMRDKALDGINATMKTSEFMRIRFAPLQSRISNYWKKMQGENFGLTRVKAIEQKQNFERLFQQEVDRNSTTKKKYGNLLADFKEVYAKNKAYTNAYDYYIELVYYSGPGTIKYFMQFEKLLEKFEQLDEKQLKIEKEKALEAHKNILASLKIQAFHEKKMWKSMFKQALTKTDKKFHPQYLVNCSDDYIENFDKIVDEIFEKSYFLNDNDFEKIIEKLNSKKIKKLKADKGYALVKSLYTSIRKDVVPSYYANRDKVGALMKQYAAAIQEVFPNKQYWYDANSTLRLTYGKVEGSTPKDGMTYTPFTTAEGILQKYIPNNDEFDVPQKLIDLINNKDYGRYGKDSTLFVCFTGSNHTTGGNSGSPVLNAKGHLIGINFDRSWESTMSDVMYSSDLCRNITVDIRYLLFIVDKYAGATHLIDELKLIETEDPLQIKREALQREIEIFSTLIKASPNKADLFFKRGKAYYELGKLKLAFSDYEKAATLSPKKEYITKRDFVKKVLSQIESIKE